MDVHMHTLFSTSSFKGYVPKMQLRSFQPSGYLENGTELNTTEVSFDPTSIQWYEEISLSEARLILERTMYPFKKVSSVVPKLLSVISLCDVVHLSYLPLSYRPPFPLAPLPSLFGCL